MRVDAEISQRELAAALGITQSVLSRIEKGAKKVPLTALLVAAQVCGYSIQAVSRRGRRVIIKSPARYEPVGVRVKRSREVRRAAA